MPQVEGPPAERVKPTDVAKPMIEDPQAQKCQKQRDVSEEEPRTRRCLRTDGANRRDCSPDEPSTQPARPPLLFERTKATLLERHEK